MMSGKNVFIGSMVSMVTPSVRLTARAAVLFTTTQTLHLLAPPKVWGGLLLAAKSHYIGGTVGARDCQPMREWTLCVGG